MMQRDESVEVIQQNDWEHCITTSTLPLFVEFWAPWCGPCHTMAPLIEAFAREYSGKARFLRVNVDESQELVARYQIFSVPTFLIFVKGEPAKRFVGMATKSYMVNMLKSCLPREG